MTHLQELSGAMVALYSLDFDDFQCSHEFSTLYWPSIECYIDQFAPLRVTPSEVVSVDGATVPNHRMVEEDTIVSRDMINH